MLRKLMSGVAVAIIALSILFITLARVSLLNIMAQEGSISNLGKNEIEIALVNESGETATEVYKLPETGILPDNMMYGFKSIRDYLWLAFSQGENKPQIALLLADKKTAEYGKLLQKDRTDLAIESGNEAMDKLEYAYNLTKKINGVSEQKSQLFLQIYKAGYAYEQAFMAGENKFSLDPEKFTGLKQRINDWNKEQEKERYTGNN